jgi:hypothetical protein
MPTPFFSMLTAFRRKKYTQFEPLIAHQTNPQPLANTGVADFSFSKNTRFRRFAHIFAHKLVGKLFFHQIH